MSTRLMITAIVYTMTNAVIFGSGIILVLTIPALARHADVLVPAVVLASLIGGAPAAWLIAPRLRARYWHPRPQALLVKY